MNPFLRYNETQAREKFGASLAQKLEEAQALIGKLPSQTAILFNINITEFLPQNFDQRHIDKILGWIPESITIKGLDIKLSGKISSYDKTRPSIRVTMEFSADASELTASEEGEVRELISQIEKLKRKHLNRESFAVQIIWPPFRPRPNGEQIFVSSPRIVTEAVKLMNITDYSAGLDVNNPIIRVLLENKFDLDTIKNEYPQDYEWVMGLKDKVLAYVVMAMVKGRASIDLKQFIKRLGDPDTEKLNTFERILNLVLEDENLPIRIEIKHRPVDGEYVEIAIDKIGVLNSLHEMIASGSTILLDVIAILEGNLETPKQYSQKEVMVLIAHLHMIKESLALRKFRVGFIPENNEKPFIIEHPQEEN